MAGHEKMPSAKRAFRVLWQSAGWSALAIALAGCRAEPTRPVGRPVNVLLVTLDTTRADRLGCYGNERISTPNLDRLAREGTQFEKAFTPVPSTLPSHCSIMTGTYPSTHGVRDNAVYFLEEGARTLAESLKAQGYATGAFVSAFVLDSRFNLDQGFDVYDDEMSLPLFFGDRPKVPPGITEGHRMLLTRQYSRFQRTAGEVAPSAIKWLRGLDSTPFFLWVHFFDPHQPYQAPRPWNRKYDPGYEGPMNGDTRTFYRTDRKFRQRGRVMPQADIDHMVARYDGEISYMDDWVGRLLQAIRDIGRYDETLVIVVGDHGESFGEHGTEAWEHVLSVYDEVVRVPLLIRRPDGVGAGTKVSGLVRTIDIAPTVLEWLALPAWEGMQGLSLLPLTDDAGAPTPGEIIIETLRGKQSRPTEWSYLGLRTDDSKIILRLRPEDNLANADPAHTGFGAKLFDLREDPAESRSVYASRRDLALQLQGSLIEAYRGVTRDVKSEIDLDALNEEALRSLGYIR